MNSNTFVTMYMTLVKLVSLVLEFVLVRFIGLIIMEPAGVYATDGCGCDNCGCKSDT